jgi:hypothetical protein
LAVYTPLGRACTVECCVSNICAPLRNSTWESGMQTGYSKPHRALRTMSKRQVLPLVNSNNGLKVKTYSDTIIVPRGTTRCSSFGPVLFNCYMNDFSTILIIGLLISYMPMIQITLYLLQLKIYCFENLGSSKNTLLQKPLLYNFIFIRN